MQVAIALGGTVRRSVGTGSRMCALLAGVVILLAVAPPAQVGPAMVAADHLLASQAGAEVLARGGNAADAAVAAALCAGVVQPAGSGLGGGGFAVGADQGEVRFALDFREVAPASATADMYVGADGAVDPQASRVGGAAVAVPGEPIGLAKLVQDHGRLSLSAVARPAVRHARQGFVVGAHLARSLSRTTLPSIRELFAVRSRVAARGDRVRRPALARALGAWASQAGRSMHRGRGAGALVRAVAPSGGGLSEADLASYETKTRGPLVGSYRGFTVVTMPPPSSGGVALLQLLSVLEGWDLQSLGHNSSDYVHLLAEAMKHVYADRAHHLGDPDFVTVPVERLLSAQRTSDIARAIWPGRTFAPEVYGPLIAPPVDAGTQHISALDRSGFAVALTTTINTSFGSGVVVPELGIILNNQMDDFSAGPGAANAYGLVGSEANAIAPGKRPLSSMTPTTVLDADGRPVLVIGASGGSTIISATLQVMLNVLDFGMDPQTAVSLPRMHHQWLPNTLWLETEYPDDVVRALTARGHEVTVQPGFSSVQVVQRHGASTVGGSDPRKGGWPAAP